MKLLRTKGEHWNEARITARTQTSLIATYKMVSLDHRFTYFMATKCFSNATNSPHQITNVVAINIKGTIRRARVILIHQLVKSSRPRGSEQSDWSLRRTCPLSVHSSSHDHEL